MAAGFIQSLTSATVANITGGVVTTNLIHGFTVGSVFQFHGLQNPSGGVQNGVIYYVVSVPTPMLRLSRLLEERPSRYRSYTTPPSTQPAEAIEPSRPM